MGWSIFYILVFPGFVFLSVYGLAVEFADRKLYARFQNRKGPPWYQPLADFIKLISKETIVPAEADKRMFKVLPVFALAAVSTAILYIPIWGTGSCFLSRGILLSYCTCSQYPPLPFSLAGGIQTPFIRPLAPSVPLPSFCL